MTEMDSGAASPPWGSDSETYSSFDGDQSPSPSSPLEVLTNCNTYTTADRKEQVLEDDPSENQGVLRLPGSCSAHDNSQGDLTRFAEFLQALPSAAAAGRDIVQDNVPVQEENRDHRNFSLATMVEFLEKKNAEQQSRLEACELELEDRNKSVERLQGELIAKDTHISSLNIKRGTDFDLEAQAALDCSHRDILRLKSIIEDKEKHLTRMTTRSTFWKSECRRLRALIRGGNSVQPQEIASTSGGENLQQLVKILVPQDEDLSNQIGSSLFFDLVDHELVKSYSVPEEVPFEHFKEELAEETGIPVNCQRFWLLSTRDNGTFRPYRALTDEEDMETVGNLMRNNSNANSSPYELKLWMEVHRTGQEGIPLPVPEITKNVDILLFFKLYLPEKDEIRFAGKLFVNDSQGPSDILGKLKEMAGFAGNENLRMYLELDLQPYVEWKCISKASMFRGRVDDGDIIIFQKTPQEVCLNPLVPLFLGGITVRNHQVVHFQRLETPRVGEFSITLDKEHTYADVVARLALQLGLDDPSKLRLTGHDFYLQRPKRCPIKYWSGDPLSDMLGTCKQTSNILYFETLDEMKTLKISFYNAKAEKVSTHNITLPKQCTISDAINELKRKVELPNQEAELRILTVLQHKIYKILPLIEKIENVDDLYFTLRAEEILEEEKDLGSRDHLIDVHNFHTRNETAQKFGEPFLLAVRKNETLAKVKVRVLNKVQVPDDEFAKWRFAFWSMGRPINFQDHDVLTSRFLIQQRHHPWEIYMGLEHTDTQSDSAPKRARQTYQV